MRSTNASLNVNFQRYKALGYPEASCVTLAAMDNILARMSKPLRQFHNHTCADCGTSYECSCVSDPLGEHGPKCGDCEPLPMQDMSDLLDRLDKENIMIKDAQFDARNQ